MGGKVMCKGTEVGKQAPILPCPSLSLSVARAPKEAVTPAQLGWDQLRLQSKLDGQWGRWPYTSSPTPRQQEGS